MIPNYQKIARFWFWGGSYPFDDLRLSGKLLTHSFDRAFALYTAALSIFLLEDDVPFNPAICGTSGSGKDFLTRRLRRGVSEHFLCGSAPPDVRRLTGFYKGVPKVRYGDAGRPVPTPKYRTDWNVFRNLRLTLRALAALLGSSQGLQLTRVLTFQSCLDSSQSSVSQGLQARLTVKLLMERDSRLNTTYTHVYRVPILI